MGLINYLLENYQYYAKPEGQDPAGKVVGLATHGVLWGVGFGVIDAVLKSHVLATHIPLHIPSVLNTVGYYVVPMTGMCVAYSTCTYIATNLRKKDDILNVTFGALAAGGVLHAWQKTAWISGYGTFFLVLIAILKKQMKDGDCVTKNLIVPDKEIVQWVFPWRNVPYRNYNKGLERWKFDREDYYRNF